MLIEVIEKRAKKVEDLPIFSPDVIILPSSEEIDRFAASCVIEQIQEKTDSVFTFPTGSTPIGMYTLLCQAYNQGDINFSKVIVTNLDEYWPIRQGHPSSYFRYMVERLITHINIYTSNWHIPNGEAQDPHVEAARYDSLLARLPPPDLAVLGIGPGKTCHIGFNEKGSTIDSRVHYVELAPETKDANAVAFYDPSEIPQGAITQGIANILNAKSILLLAKGPGKARGIQRSLQGPINSDAPASFLRHHPNVTVVVDIQAGQYLK